MFAGHNAYRFASDPFYANGYIPTVRELVDRLADRRLVNVALVEQRTRFIFDHSAAYISGHGS